MTDLIERLRDTAKQRARAEATDVPGNYLNVVARLSREDAVLMGEASDELDRLRKLDAEYGRVEAVSRIWEWLGGYEDAYDGAVHFDQDDWRDVLSDLNDVPGFMDSIALQEHDVEPPASAKLYQIDIPIAATLYVKATSAETAAALARCWQGDTLELSGDGIDGRMFQRCIEDPDFTAALSPAMTVGGFPMGDRDMSDITADDMQECDE